MSARVLAILESEEYLILDTGACDQRTRLVLMQNVSQVQKLAHLLLKSAESGNR